MNTKHLPLFFILSVIFFAACKKESSPIVGKWQEVKMRTYNQDLSTGAISGDTTYQAATFGVYDYAQFNNDGICVISETGFIGTAAQVVKVQDLQDYTYTKAGSGFVLVSTANPSAISGEMTGHNVSSVSSNTLIIHSVTGYLNPSVAYKTISDSYYTK